MTFPGVASLGLEITRNLRPRRCSASWASAWDSPTSAGTVTSAGLVVSVGSVVGGVVVGAVVGCVVGLVVAAGAGGGSRRRGRLVLRRSPA